MVKRFVNWMALRPGDPDVAVAQFAELQRQIPLLYALLSVNSVAVAWTRIGNAPEWMVIWTPAALTAVSILRLLRWLKAPAATVDGQQALLLLRRTTLLAAALGLAYISWALSLNGSGNPQQQAHVAIFVSITLIGCLTCLMHLPQAAVATTVVVCVPYLGYYLASGDPSYMAIAINLLLVTLVMIRVLMNSFGGFRKLVRTQAETERLNREVTKLAHTDMLTGLPNRRLFFAETDLCIRRARAAGLDVALGVIDLDRFKAANDTFGHLLGDQLLEAVGTRLREIFGPTRMVARLGGDEFAFVVTAGGESAMALAADACASLARPFALGDVTISIGASCGVATTRDVAGTARALYDGADYALYKAKAGRRGFPTLYSAEHEQGIRSERAVEAALQVADLDAEMDILLQPIAGTRDGAIFAVEALARWQSPSLGRVPPNVFIPLAERAGIIHGLTLTLLAKALARLERLPGDIKLSFNLSAHDITCHETVLGIMALIRRSNVPPSRLVMELTETAVVRDFEAAEASMRLFRSLGVSIALDDFGTGQSSLSYLRRLPIDRVKIDRSFVSGTDEGAGRELLSAVVALCKSMRMQCIAEGVETRAQLDFLNEIGCDAFQGYLLAMPLPIEELLPWTAARIPTPAARA